MKNFLKSTILLGAIVIAANAFADEGDSYVFIVGAQLEPDTAFLQDDGWAAQLGLGKEVHHWFNVEGYVRYSDADGSTSFTNTAFGGDVQLVLFRDSVLEPYLFGGMGFQQSQLTGMGSERQSMVNLGAGFRANIFGDSDASLRAEYRYSNYESHGVNLDDKFFSVGFQVPFGKKAAPPVVAAAPAAPPEPEPEPLDSDGDGVIDDMDQCPGTVRGAVVDATGCELDGDNDGVVDRLDECPNSAPGVQVDIRGCEIREEIDLPGVNFESNSDRLLPGAESVLNDAAATLRKNPEIKVEVAGHTDSDGSEEHNASLSARRATTVRDFLAGRGVDDSRMTVRGYGESEPIASNATAEGKAANRRVVLRITER